MLNLATSTYAAPKASSRNVAIFFNVRDPGELATFTSGVGGYEDPLSFWLFTPAHGQTYHGGPTPAEACTFSNDTNFEQEVRVQFRIRNHVHGCTCQYFCTQRTGFATSDRTAAGLPVTWWRTWRRCRRLIGKIPGNTELELWLLVSTGSSGTLPFPCNISTWKWRFHHELP